MLLIPLQSKSIKAPQCLKLVEKVISDTCTQLVRGVLVKNHLVTLPVTPVATREKIAMMMRRTVHVIFWVNQQSFSY